MTRSKMNPEIKKQWVAALRSGEYRQGKKQLNNDGRFCCLGVLCDLAVKAGVEVGVTEVGLSVSYDDSRTYLPWSVREWAGLDENPRVRNRSGGASLSLLNDEGMPFDKIADLIEADL